MFDKLNKKYGLKLMNHYENALWTVGAIINGESKMCSTSIFSHMNDAKMYENAVERAIYEKCASKKVRVIRNKKYVTVESI